MKFTQALEQGEKLLPQTATPGREEVRQELRDLREQWEAHQDNLAQLDRSLQALLAQWAAYEDRHQQMTSWLASTQASLTQASHPQTSLLEKKAALQHYKVCVEGVMTQPCFSPEMIMLQYTCIS